MKYWNKLKFFRAVSLKLKDVTISRAEKQAEFVLDNASKKDVESLKRIVTNQAFMDLMDSLRIDMMLQEDDFKNYPNRLQDLLLRISKK